MKKRSRSIKRSSTRKSSSRGSTQHIVLLPFSLKRIIFITTSIALFLGVVVLFNKPQITQSVAGIGVARGFFAEARVDLPDIKNAVSFNVYYKKQSASDYTNVARDIPANIQYYTISYLKKGEEYHYKIAAVDASGAEFSWTNEQVLTNIEPM